MEVMLTVNLRPEDVAVLEREAADMTKWAQTADPRDMPDVPDSGYTIRDALLWAVHEGIQTMQRKQRR